MTFSEGEAPCVWVTCKENRDAEMGAEFQEKHFKLVPTEIQSVVPFTNTKSSVTRMQELISEAQMKEV